MSCEWDVIKLLMIIYALCYTGGNKRIRGTREDDMLTTELQSSGSNPHQDKSKLSQDDEQKRKNRTKMLCNILLNWS